MSFGGTWERIKGKVLVGVDENDDDFNVAGKTGGAKTTTLSVSNLPTHSHTGLTYNYEWKIGNTMVQAGNSANALIVNKTSGSSLVTGSTGNGTAFSRLQPYTCVYIWKRTA